MDWQQFFHDFQHLMSIIAFVIAMVRYWSGKDWQWPACMAITFALWGLLA